MKFKGSGEYLRESLAVTREDRILETRRSLASLYSNLSLQHMGFSLVMILAFLTVVTNYDKYVALGIAGPTLFYVSFLVVLMQGCLGFGRTVFWSYVANAVVYRAPDLKESDDVMTGLVTSYVGSVATEHLFIRSIGDISVTKIMVYTCLAGLVGLVVGLYAAVA